MLRELKVKTSYRLNVVLSGISAFAALLTYAFLGNTALGGATNQDYGMSLVAFLASGVAFGSIMTGGISTFFEYALPSQIEEVMVTPIDFRVFLLFSSLLGIVVSVGSAVLLFSVSILLFGLSYSYNFPLLGANIVLGIASSLGLGLLGLGFQLRYKQSQFLAWLLYTFTGLLGNMIVPVQVLPSFLQIVSYATPQYYFFTGIRAALGGKTGNPTLLLASFTLYTLALVLAGLVALKLGVRSVKRNGTHRWT